MEEEGEEEEEKKRKRRRGRKILTSRIALVSSGAHLMAKSMI